jgi:hypothetical protein
MRKQHQRQLLALLKTCEEAQDHGLYADCQDAALAMVEFIEEQEGKGTHTAEVLKEYYRLLYRVYNGEIDKSPLYQQLRMIEACIKTELKPTKFKALFLPYYDNTWESMKSVYEAFSRDPLFETEVVITPIIRNTNEGPKFVWQDYLTPVGIPNTRYDRYSVEFDRPDVVFYNQPYDGVNIPKYRSRNIRQYADCMVYIPYGVKKPIPIQGAQNTFGKFTSVQLCDIFIAQSETFRQHNLTGTLFQKALVTGHPKWDCLYAAKRNGEYVRYSEWETAIGGRRVILLNTHYTYMIDGVDLHPGVKRLIDRVDENEDLFLIWRPHPQAFLMKMSASMKAMLRIANMHERMLVDCTPSMTSAFAYAHAVVSLFPSTIIMDALFLDLPVFVLGRDDFIKNPSGCLTNPFYTALLHEDFTHHPPDRNADPWMVQNYIENSIYAPLDAFIEEVKNGEDSKREARAAFRKQEFPNSDGTVAQTILQIVKERLWRDAAKPLM